jgi:hypothetical protein
MVGNVLIAEVASQRPPALADGIHDPDIDPPDNPASPSENPDASKPPQTAPE